MEDKHNQTSPWPKENPFGTPEGYFDTLEGRILDRVAAEEEVKAPKTPIIRMLAPYAAVAAMFLLVFMAWNFVLNKFPGNSPDAPRQAQQISDTLYLDYYDIHEATIAEQFATIADSAFQDSIDQSESQAIIEYLAYEDIDYALSAFSE